MIKSEVKLPEWKAPDSLLLKVMSEVDKIERNKCFFSWRLIHQILFSGAVCISVVMAFYLSYGFDFNCNPLSFSTLVYREYSVWYNNVINLNRIVSGYLLDLSKHPGYLSTLFIICAFVIIAWTGSITALYRMLITQSGRKYL